MCARFPKLVHSSSTLILRFGMERGSTRKPDQFATVFFKLAGTQKNTGNVCFHEGNDVGDANASDVRDDRVHVYPIGANGSMKRVHVNAVPKTLEMHSSVKKNNTANNVTQFAVPSTTVAHVSPRVHTDLCSTVGQRNPRAHVSSNPCRRGRVPGSTP